MRRFTLVIVLLVIMGCDKSRPLRQGWPARIAEVNGFDSACRERLENAVDEMNQLAGTEILSLDSEGDAYPIEFSLVQFSPEHAGRVGFAVSTNRDCKVELAEELCDEKAAFFASVTIHEIGHCAGYGHSDELGEVMYKAALPFESYTEDALDRFADQIRSVLE